jgi:long-chain acyl-CoA synthetase
VLHTRFDLDTVMNDWPRRSPSLPGCRPCSPPWSTTRRSTLDLKSLKFAAPAALRCPAEIEHRFFALTGCHLNEGWGMTETSPTGTFTPARGRRKDGSCGMPLPGIRLKFEALATGSAGTRKANRADVHRGTERDEGYWKNEAPPLRR